MNNQSSPPRRKGARWIVDQIAAAFDSSGGGAAPAERLLSRPDVDDLVGRTLEKELERLELEKE